MCVCVCVCVCVSLCVCLCMCTSMRICTSNGGYICLILTYRYAAGPINTLNLQSIKLTGGA